MNDYVSNKDDVELYNADLVYFKNVFELDNLNISDAVHDIICQLDGVDDLVSYTAPPPGNVKPGRQQVQTSVKFERYRLNQKKQLNKLKQDASISNLFSITVSPTEQSVSILCSTGFYALVAVPALSSITIGSKRQVAGVALFCNDITGKVDYIGATVNAVIHLRYSSSDPTSNGCIVVHIHHTVRKVQIQGSSMIDRRMRANVWFVENYLLEMFTTMSQSKAFNTSEFNTAVTKMVSNHIEKMNAKEKCAACLGLFSGRSVHEKCNVCFKNFHKKCSSSAGHQCISKLNCIESESQRFPVSFASTSGLSAMQSASSSISSGTLTTATISTILSPAVYASATSPPNATTTNTRHLLVPTSCTAPTRTTMSSPTISLSYPLPSIPATTSASASGDTSTIKVPAIDGVINSSSHDTHFNLSAPPFQPRAGPSSAKGKGKAKNQTKSALATSSEGIDLEFAKIEINTIRAKLTDREKQVKDLEFQNSILLERISVLEKSEKQKIFDRYFPKPASSNSPNHSNLNIPCPEPIPQANCQTACRHHCCVGVMTQTQPQLSSDVIDHLIKSVSELRDDIAIFKSRFTLSEEAAPQIQPNDKPTSHYAIPEEGTAEDAFEDHRELSDDDSIMTIDECVPELPVEESLNFNVQTTQLVQLRQQNAERFQHLPGTVKI